MVRQKHGTALRDWVMGTEREWVFCKPPTSTSTLTWCSTPQRVTEEKAHHCPHTTTQPHASLLTDSTARTQHTHKHTHRTQPNMTGKEKDRKQKVQKKKSEQSLKPILGGKEEDFWGASTYWIILEIPKKLFDNTHYLPDHKSCIVSKMKLVMTDESKTTLCFASPSALTGPEDSEKLHGLQYTLNIKHLLSFYDTKHNSPKSMTCNFRWTLKSRLFWVFRNSYNSLMHRFYTCSMFTRAGNC